MNIFISLAGWFAWNVIIFRIDKDQADDRGIDFPLKQYALQSYDNWLASLALVPIILYFGYKGLGIPGAFSAIDITGLTWSDAYYVASGFFTEAIIFAIKKWKAARQ